MSHLFHVMWLAGQPLPRTKALRKDHSGRAKFSVVGVQRLEGRLSFFRILALRMIHCEAPGYKARQPHVQNTFALQEQESQARILQIFSENRPVHRLNYPGCQRGFLRATDCLMFWPTATALGRASYQSEARKPLVPTVRLSSQVRSDVFFLQMLNIQFASFKYHKQLFQ